jgi:hypothetical protein
MYFLNYLCVQSNEFDYLSQIYMHNLRGRFIKGKFDYKGIHFIAILPDLEKGGEMLRMLLCMHSCFVNHQKGKIVALNNFFDLSISKIINLNFIISMFELFCTNSYKQNQEPGQESSTWTKK